MLCKAIKEVNKFHVIFRNNLDLEVWLSNKTILWLFLFTSRSIFVLGNQQRVAPLFCDFLARGRQILNGFCSLAIVGHNHIFPLNANLRRIVFRGAYHFSVCKLFFCSLFVETFREVYKEFLLLVPHFTLLYWFLLDLLGGELVFFSRSTAERNCPAHFVSLNTKEEDDSFFAFYRQQFNELICYRFFHSTAGQSSFSARTSVGCVIVSSQRWRSFAL